MNQTEQIIQVLSRALGTFGVLLSLTQNTTALHIIKEQIRDLNKAIDHVEETTKNEHDSADVLKPAKLVRLTEMELWRNDELMALNAEFGLLFPDVQRFANAIMDAMIKKNGGSHATD